MGYFGIGVVHGKTESNLGTLWRSAYQLGASFIFTIGARYKRQSSDTVKAWRHIPLFCYPDFASFSSAHPYDAEWVGVEFPGKPLKAFRHPDRAVYFLGAEDHGLHPEALERMHRVVELPSVRQPSFNVAVAGSLVMADRMMKRASAEGK